MNGEYNLNKMDVDVLRRNLGWFMAFGVGLIILGAISVAAPFLATFAIVNLVGILFLIAHRRQVKKVDSFSWKFLLLRRVS